MRAGVMNRHDLDVQLVPATVRFLVLDTRIRELHVPVEAGQVVLTPPFFDLRLVAIGTAIAVSTATIPLLQKLLVLAPQLVV